MPVREGVLLPEAVAARAVGSFETQRVQLVATTAPPGGEFELTVTFGDLSTAISEAVSADASAEDVRGALQALGVGPVKVTRARADRSSGGVGTRAGGRESVFCREKRLA